MRRVLLVLELQKRALGAECVRLLALIAKNEKENRWRVVMGKKGGTTRPRRGAVGDAPRVFGGGLSLGFFQKRVVW